MSRQIPNPTTCNTCGTEYDMNEHELCPQCENDEYSPYNVLGDPDLIE